MEALSLSQLGGGLILSIMVIVMHVNTVTHLCIGSSVMLPNTPQECQDDMTDAAVQNVSQRLSSGKGMMIIGITAAARLIDDM